VGIVEERLRKLAKSRNLSTDETAKLAGMDITVFRNRINEGLNYRNKKQVSKLIIEQRPILENWSKASGLAEKWNVPIHLAKTWYYSESSRKETGAVKVREMSLFNCEKEVYRFSPEWEKTIDDKIEGLGGLDNIIYSSDIDEVIDFDRRRAFNLKSVPQGRFTKACRTFFYKKDNVMILKNKLDKSNDLITEEEVVGILDISPNEIMKYISFTTRHPITKKRLYERKYVESFRGFTEKKCAIAILKECEENIHYSEDLYYRICEVIHKGTIPYENVLHKRRYISSEDELKIQKMYVHQRTIDKQIYYGDNDELLKGYKRLGIVDNETKLLTATDIGEMVGIKQNAILSFSREFRSEEILSEMEVDSEPTPVLLSHYEDDDLSATVPCIKYLSCRNPYFINSVGKIIAFHLKRAFQNVESRYGDWRSMFLYSVEEINSDILDGTINDKNYKIKEKIE